jgi:hypothetical protein
LIKFGQWIKYFVSFLFLLWTLFILWFLLVCYFFLNFLLKGQYQTSQERFSNKWQPIINNKTFYIFAIYISQEQRHLVKWIQNVFFVCGSFLNISNIVNLKKSKGFHNSAKFCTKFFFNMVHNDGISLHFELCIINNLMMYHICRFYLGHNCKRMQFISYFTCLCNN